MRIRSALFVFGFVSLSSMAALVACGSSSSSGDDSSVANDASNDVTTSDVEAPITSNASDISVYIGQLTKLAGSASSTTATFSWTIDSAPTGSTITTASLTGATTATPSFTPDLVGDYKLTLTAHAGAKSATSPATVHALPGKAFFGHEFVNDAGIAVDDVLVANADGTGRSAIVCPLAFSGFAQERIASGGLDWLEGDAGDPVAVAFPFQEISDSGVTSVYVAAGTSDSRCGSPSISKLDVHVDAGVFPQHTRLSSSGKRIAYLRDDGVSIQAATIGFDGSDLRVFGAAFIGSDGGPGESGSSATVPPVWIDDTQIAWIVSRADLTSWSIQVVRDEPVATVATFMTCTSAFTPASGSPPFVFPAQTKIFQFDLLPDGTAIVATQLSTVDAGNFVQLLVLHPNASTHQCELVRSFSGAESGTARDFAISPDKKSVAFLGSQTASNGTFVLYVAPLDGTSPPVAVSGAPTQSIEGNGPRWVAKGHTLVWGQGPITDGGSANNVLAIPAKGGTVKVVAASDVSTESFYSVGNSCNVAFENASPVAAFAMLGIFIGLIVRRRRNSK